MLTIILWKSYELITQLHGMNSVMIYICMLYPFVHIDDGALDLDDHAVLWDLAHKVLTHMQLNALWELAGLYLNWPVFQVWLYTY